MRRLLGLASIVLWGPTCALSFEPRGLGAADASAADHQVDATPSDGSSVQDFGAEPSDGGEVADALVSDAADGGLADGDLGPTDSGLEVVIDLDMSGATDTWYHSRPSGLDCLGSGRFSVPYATVWELEAMPSPTRVFNRWTRGPCNTSTVSVCRFTADADLTIRADYNPH